MKILYARENEWSTFRFRGLVHFRLEHVTQWQWDKLAYFYTREVNLSSLWSQASFCSSHMLSLDRKLTYTAMLQTWVPVLLNIDCVYYLIIKIVKQTGCTNTNELERIIGIVSFIAINRSTVATKSGLCDLRPNFRLLGTLVGVTSKYENVYISIRSFTPKPLRNDSNNDHHQASMCCLSFLKNYQTIG